MSATHEGSEEEWTSLEKTRYGLLFLPPELLGMVLSRVGLRDLLNLRQVCRRLREMVEGAGRERLWAAVSLDDLAVDSQQLSLIERAAGCGNKEALIKLAMAFLYNQGVPRGEGVGTLDSWNGTRAAELLLQLDSTSPTSRPIAWFLIRPPWSSSVSNKVCAHHKIMERCLNQQNLALNEERSEEGTSISGIYYNLGRTANFLKLDGKTVEEGHTAIDWFNRGVSNDCPFSALEVWRRTMKPHLATKEVPAVRSLRKIIAMGNQTSIIDSKLELCKTYAAGHYGSVCRDEALAFIREMMTDSQPSLHHRMFHFQSDITHIMRYITVDWMIEIAELKSLSRHTLHQAITLFDAYLLSRQVNRSSLQLLGVTSILIASRWSGDTMLTIRESSWLTENTYSYEEVVKMMAELLGTFQGDIQRLTISDYLEVLLALVEANSVVKSMTSYLSEAVLLHLDLTMYSSAHLAAACLLTAQILLRQDYPWPAIMEQSSGFSLSYLSSSCLQLYKKCVTKEFAVADHRGVELCAITVRYSHPSHNCISKREIMPLEEFSERLGVTPDLSSSSSSSSPSPQKTKHKLFSFLSDSCYLSSPLRFSGSESSEPDSDPAEDKRKERVSDDEEDNRKCNLSSSASSISDIAYGPTQSGIGYEALSSPSSPPHHHHLSSTSSLPHQDILTASDPNLTQCNTHSLPLLQPSVRGGSESLVCIPTSSSSSLSPGCQRSQYIHPIPPNTSLLPLSHHRSLISCSTEEEEEVHCSRLSPTGKTERAHVSCPNFHSHSTNDMELGMESTDDDDEDEEMEIEFSSRSSSATGNQQRTFLHSGSEGPDFHLPPLNNSLHVPLQTLGVRNSPKTTPPNGLEKQKSSTEKRLGTKVSPVGGLENANSGGSLKNRVPSTHRNPLLSLTNTPRQQVSRKI